MNGGSQLIPDKKRLRWILIAFFLALAIPTAIFVFKSLDQLKWQAVYQYRGLARELSERIDADLARRAARETNRGLTDYQFFSNAEAGGNIVQRSPLSALPLITELPGTIGYFQVDANGQFSSPLLPTKQLEQSGLAVENLAQRQARSQRILRILGDNELIAPPRPGELREQAIQGHNGAPSGTAKKEALRKDSVRRKAEVTLSTADAPGAEEREMAGPVPSLAAPAPTTSSTAESTVATSPASSRQKGRSEQRQTNKPIDTEAADLLASRNNSLFNFDQLSRVSPSQKIGANKSKRSLRKLDEYKLDQSLQQRAATRDQQTTGAAAANESDQAASKPVETAIEEQAVDKASAKITTFEKDVDPFALSRLNSGHLVLYRKAWYRGQRLVQGLLIDANELTSGLIRTGFVNSGMATTTDLTVAFGDSVLQTFSGPGSRSYQPSESLRGSTTLSGSVLYESALSEPFNNVRLVYSVKKLPSNVGSSLVTWLGLLVLSVLAIGLYALYRLGIRRLELASQQQDFVAAVSHELKTPLTSIRMYGEMLREGWASEDKKATYYDFIHDESERLSRLIDNVLQLARVNHDDIPVNLRSVALGEIVDMIRSKTSGQIERAGFSLTISNDIDSSEVVLVDSDLLQQVMINLIDNALKFSGKSERRQIDISVTSATNGIAFSVRDYGPGIAEDQIRKIFQLFYRAETELTRETVGTGIGLALVNQLVKAMNGKVDVLNRNPGAQFQVVLPRA